jgi:hypothetical protein
MSLTEILIIGAFSEVEDLITLQESDMQIEL